MCGPICCRRFVIVLSSVILYQDANVKMKVETTVLLHISDSVSDTIRRKLID